MNKIGRPTYPINYKESFIVATANIYGGHGLTLDSNFHLRQLQHIIKAVKFWCSGNEILNMVTPEVFPTSCQACQ